MFLDCCEEHPLESHEDWCARMLQEVEYSRYLIFVASSPEYLKEGNGWLYQEVSQFQKLKTTRNRRNAGDRNLGYFGILFTKIDFERELFSHPKLGSDYRRLYDQPEHLVLSPEDTVSSAAERIGNKVMTLIETMDVETAAELLDKTREFADEKKSSAPLFDHEMIRHELLPLLKDEDHRLLQSRFDTANHFNGRGKIHGYLKFGEQAFFAQAFRIDDEDTTEERIAEKVGRITLISTHYKHLTRDGMIPEPMERPPVVVLIGESYEHCVGLYEIVKKIDPHIRKLFTYDSLLVSEQAFTGLGNYLEFAEGKAYSVRLEDVIL